MLVTTLGCPKANSYVSLERADDVMPLYDPSWSSRSAEEKEFIMRSAAADVDRVPFLGRKLLLGQSMAWPRTSDALVNRYVLKSGFERVQETVETTVDAPASYDATFSRQVTSDTVSFLLNDPEFMAAPLGSRNIELRHVNAQGTHVSVLTERDVTETKVTPEVKDEFGNVIQPGGTALVHTRIWNVTSRYLTYPDGKSANLDAPALQPDFTFSDSGVLTAIAVNGSDVNIFTEYAQAIGITHHSVTSTVTRVSPNKLRNGSLIYADRADMLPTYCLGAAVHCMCQGERIYGNVIAHNPYTGILTMDVSIPEAWNDENISYMYIDPLLPEVIDAQLTQMKVRVGAVTSDPYAGLGIASIKVGDTSRTYTDPSSSMQTLISIAGRLGISPQTLIAIGKFTTYNKMSIGWQRDIDDALETSTDATS